MSEVAHDAQHEFWRPPVAQPNAGGPTLVEACDGCGTEFIAGAQFCHVCGSARSAQPPATAARGWTQYLEFHNIKQFTGLSTAPLVAFIIGIACVLGAIAAGIIYSERNVLEWQAVQMFRIQWLLGAAVAFVAAILLKKTSR